MKRKEAKLKPILGKAEPRNDQVPNEMFSFLDDPGSEAKYEKTQTISKVPQDTSSETTSSKHHEEPVDIKEVEELEFCLYGNPGMIITRKRTEATIRHKGRLR